MDQARLGPPRSLKPFVPVPFGDRRVAFSSRIKSTSLQAKLNAFKVDFPGELLRLDLADRAATQDVLADLVARRKVDAVVNNVGLVRPQPIGAVTLDALAAVLDLNLRTAVQTVQAMLPGMKARHWGRIVKVSSLTVLGTVERTAYAAAKAGLISSPRGWALELARDGITVNAVAPGPTKTELFRANNPPGRAGETRYLDAVPMGRSGQPDEIAAAIAFLLSDEAAFITG